VLSKEESVPSTIRTRIGGTDGKVLFLLALRLPLGGPVIVPVLDRAKAVRGEEGLGGTLDPAALAAAAPAAAGPRGAEGGELPIGEGAPLVPLREAGPK